MNENELVPIFPLGIVMLPEQLIPLHIFEERYKLMIDECLADDKVFGIVYFDGQKMCSAGCSARVQEVLKKYPNGRLDIVTRGERRFIVGQLDESKPYLQATVDYFDDDPEEPDADMQRDALRGLMLLNQVVGLEPHESTLDLAVNPAFKSISFLVAGSAGFNAPEKQKFLEMTSTRKRLQKSVAALSRIIDRIRLTEEIQSLIGGNGSLPDSLKQSLSGL
ncbi:MAG: LON peptidase substrate-binding domain-containing protein [Desulfobacterales bacterium]|jgi:Lon protease-like protein